VTAANNLLAAMVDNHLQQGNALGSTPRHHLEKGARRQRPLAAQHRVGLGTREDGTPRETGFDITAASEVMAVLALATSLQDLRAASGGSSSATPRPGEPVTAEQLKAAGAMTVIMRDAIKPNLLQTLENTPVLVHAGPFGNIAHGNSSVVADLIGIHAGEYLITEAGFGSDMGAERFFNIKCRTSGLVPDAAVVVATVRALKLHSGRHKVTAGRPLPPAMLAENPEEVHLGAANLLKHLEIVRRHGVTPVVAINAFAEDFPSEHEAIREIAASVGVRAAVCTHFVDGGRVPSSWRRRSSRRPRSRASSGCSTRTSATLRQKIETIATEVYGADGVDYLPLAARQIDTYERPASAICRCASPRRTSPSPRTRPSRGRRPVGAFRCAKPEPTSGPASSTWSAGTCGRCPASRRARPPSGSTSTTRATWSASTTTRRSSTPSSTARASVCTGSDGCWSPWGSSWTSRRWTPVAGPGPGPSPERLSP
jgi:formate--tetrahydrofolate ligase